MLSKKNNQKLEVLVISLFFPKIAKTFHEHLLAFKLSQYRVSYLFCNGYTPKTFNLDSYDVIILHYGLSLHSIDFKQQYPDITNQIKSFNGLKICITQDEYMDPLNIIKNFNEFNGVDIALGFLDKNSYNKVFGNRLRCKEYITVLSGYVWKKNNNRNIKPIFQRKLDIVYRGNNLGLLYGKLGYEKFEIGAKMKQLSKQYNLKIDIDWKSEKKIFKSKWIKFLSSGKATLITESGSSLVIDDVKSKHLTETTQEMSKVDSIDDFLYQEKRKEYSQYLQDDEQIIMSGISPKVFEAIQMKTALIAYEGNYSNIIKPNIHYIPLKKNWSNIENVIKKLKNNDYLQNMVDKTYEDIILSDKYDYKKFLEFIDRKITKYAKNRNLLSRNNNLVNLNRLCFSYFIQNIYCNRYLRYFARVFKTQLNRIKRFFLYILIIFVSGFFIGFCLAYKWY